MKGEPEIPGYRGVTGVGEGGRSRKISQRDAGRIHCHERGVLHELARKGASVRKGEVPLNERVCKIVSFGLRQGGNGMNRAGEKAQAEKKWQEQTAK